MNTPEIYLKEALLQAKAYRGFCAPNPAVGAVIVKNNQIIAKGAHKAAGLPHAEIEALKHCEAQGAALYVSLEPCNHQGRTPACTQAIIESGIAEVYFAYRDPNPTVKGGGADYLNEQGVKAQYISMPEADEFYQSYDHWLKTQRPYVAAKLAFSLDGKIASKESSPVAITGPEAQLYTHQKRRQSDAILTSVRTIIHDNPALNVRLDNEVIAKSLYIIDRIAALPLNAAVFKTAASITVFHGVEADEAKIKALLEKGVRCFEIKTNARGLDELAMIQQIGQEGVHDLWIEAGGRCFESFYSAGLIHRVLFYIAPKSLGVDALPAFQRAHDFSEDAKKLKWHSLGQDLILEMEMNTL